MDNYMEDWIGIEAAASYLDVTKDTIRNWINGAFKSPSILLKKGEIKLTDKCEEHAEYLVGLVDEHSRNFMEQYDIRQEGDCGEGKGKANAGEGCEEET